MKKIIIILALFVSCKKETPSTTSNTIPTPVVITKNIKYEVLGTCCCLDVNYLYNGTIQKIICANQGNWNYTFTEKVGTPLQLEARSMIGAVQQNTRVNIYQDGQLTKQYWNTGWVTIQDTVK